MSKRQTLVDRLRSRSYEDRHHRKYREEAAREIERLRVAIIYARCGLQAAYHSAENGRMDEVLWHCGHHDARLAGELE